MLMDVNVMYQVKLEALKYARSTFVDNSNVSDEALLSVAEKLYNWIAQENKIVTV